MVVEWLVLKNTFFLSAGKALGDLCTFFFLVYFARCFGTEGLGEYAFAMSVGGLACIFIDLGMDTLMVREVSKDKRLNAKYAGNLLAAESALGALVWAAIALYAWATPCDPDAKAVVVLMGGYHVFNRLTFIFRGQFRAHEETQYTALLEISHRLAILLLGAVAIIVFESHVAAIAAFPASALGMFVVGFAIAVRRYGRLDLKPDVAFIRHAIAAAVPFFLLIVVSTAWQRSGVILLTHLEGESVTGIYSAADRFLVSITAGLAAFGGALFPALSKVSAVSRENLVKLYERSVRVMIVCLVPLALAVNVLSDHIIALTFGRAYAESAQVLRALSTGLIFIGLNQCASSLLLVANRQRALLAINAIGCGGFIALSAVMIQRLGGLGLAWSQVAASAFSCIASMGYAWRMTGAGDLLRTALTPGLCALLGFAVLVLTAGFSPWVSLPTVLSTYGVAMVLLKGVHLHDLAFLKAILGGSSS